MTRGAAMRGAAARGARLVVVPLVLALTVGCGGAAGADDRTLMVYAAASLGDGFEELAEEFEAAHDGVEVRLNLAGSSDLAAQIQQGAPAEVFASADEQTMARLVADGLVGEPRVFAANTLQIAVPPGNPAGIESIDDLGAAGADEVSLVVCAPQVPCGAATRELAAAAGVELAPVSEEQSVTDVLGKVASGEADAGLVYVTDVRAAGGEVEGIDVPRAAAAVNRYPIATVTDDDGAATLAEEFVDLVLGPTGQEVLAAAGFRRP